MSLHWGMVLNVAAKKHISQRKCQAAGFIIGLLTAAYRVYVFITTNFLTYMFLRNEFVFLDYEELKFKFFLDYFALMGCVFSWRITLQSWCPYLSGGGRWIFT